MDSRALVRPNKNWKTQFYFTESASALHNRVRDILTTDSYFKLLKIYQEVPCYELIPSYPHRHHRYDWFIYDLSVILELHGEQHYSMVNFGNIGYNQARREFISLQQRDATKQQAAIDAGFSYLVISHRQKLIPFTLKQIILEGSHGRQSR